MSIQRNGTRSRAFYGALLSIAVVIAAVAAVGFARRGDSGGHAVRTGAAAASASRSLVGTSHSTAVPKETPDTVAQSSVPTTAFSILPPAPTYTKDGPLSQQLKALVQPLVPPGSSIVTARDQGGTPPIATVEYRLPNGQLLHLVKENFSLPLPPGVSPQSVVRNPATDSVTKLGTGSWLAQIGHGPGVSQVILLRPSGAFINVQLITPLVSSGGNGPLIDPSITTAYTLESLASIVKETFDTSASDA